MLARAHRFLFVAARVIFAGAGFQVRKRPDSSGIRGVSFATMLDSNACYDALLARDARFDGAFFIAVATTGIYCRPICPARTPRRDRCEFYRSAAEAEKAGYRGCLRCRPELSPGRAPVDAISHLVGRAVALIEDGYLNERPVEALAGTLGVTDRHLRRSLESELGVSPVELAQSRRLALAKQLLQDTALPLAEVAFASGFGSLRRFNALFLQRFGRPPSALRRQTTVTRQPARPLPSRASASEARAVGRPSLRSWSRRSWPEKRASARAIELRLDYRPPLEWEALLEFLRQRAIPGVESVRGLEYRRVVRLGERLGTIAVRPFPGRPSLLAAVSIAPGPALMGLVARLRALFDLDAAPAAIAAGLARDRTLARHVRARPGLRVPGAFDAFETVVRAVIGQQVSVAAATTVAGRLVARFGARMDEASARPDLRIAFPEPGRLAGATESDLARLGMPGRRARCLLGVARIFASKPVGLPRGASAEGLLDELLALEGFGEWTAQVVAMRAFRSTDAFPAGDLGVRKALGGVSEKAARERSEVWRPWRSYAVMHLWTSLLKGETR